MVNNQNLIFFLTCLSLFILSPPQTCDAVLASCTPSSCGLLPNITAPFRLNTDPISCGNPQAEFELSCEDGVASIHVDSQKYYVKEIDYGSSTVRLSHILPNNNNSSNDDDICKYFSPSTDKFTFLDAYSLSDYEVTNQPISFVSCANPLQNHSLLTRVAECEEEGSGRHTYLKLGPIRAKELDYMCTLDSVLATAWNFTTDLNNTSLSEIHKSLFYGFSVPLFFFMCRECSSGCSSRSDGQYICLKIHSGLYYHWLDLMESFNTTYGPVTGPLMIFMVVVVVVFAGVTIPLKIIVGFGVCTWVLLQNWDRSMRYDVLKKRYIAADNAVHHL